MGQNWAMTIGINQYRNLQWLQYAKRDAEALRDYFSNEVNFQQVYHFTDDSPVIAQDYGPPIDSTPTYATLRRFLRVRFDQPFLKTGDNFWFFFAGHGVRYEDRDYLMPIDADPGDVESTAIPLHYIAERLCRCGADNVIVFLDACRSDVGRRDGLGIGTEVQQGIVTISACSPRESSYEIEQLQHGAFTYSLLQGLRIQGEGNCATVERLEQHLRSRVPELNQRYNKPRQTPYTVVEPAAKYYLILLARQATVRDAETLKMEAFKAEANREFELAEQFWIRVLTVSPGDLDAIAGIRRLPQIQPEPNQPEPTPASTGRGRQNSSPNPGGTQPSSRGTNTRVQTFLPNNLTRRRFIQIAGFTGAGVGATLLGRVILYPPPTSTPSPTPAFSPGGEIVTPRKSGPTSTPSPTSTFSPTRDLPELNSFEFTVVTVDAKGRETKRQQGKAQSFSETIGDSTGLEMVAIPGGTFQMGSPSGEVARDGSEGPQHQVIVQPFLIGKYQVTQAQWKAVAAFPKVSRDLTADPSNFKGANLPVERISWFDAVEFCARLSRKAGYEYRLPSEAEWEYACRAGTTTPFHFGATITTELANYDGSYSYGSGPKGMNRQKTTPVGSFKIANAFGLYDMHGNVWEWCEDHWHENYNDAPTGGSAWISTNEHQNRLIRGGSWFNGPRFCRSAYRSYVLLDKAYPDTGFRVVCVAPRTL